MKRKLTHYLILSAFLFFGVIPPINAQDTILLLQLTIPIQTGNDDVEERSDGSIYLNSSDLELVNDPSNAGDQIIGLHFEHIALGQGADYLLLKFSALETAPFTLRIYDILGKLVYVENHIAEPMIQEYSIDVRNWASGLYFLEATIAERTILEKLMVK